MSEIKLNSLIKLTITGASGVGKTTLAKQLAAELQLPLIPELGRTVCHELGHERIGDIPDQEGFKRLVLQRQIQEESSRQSFVADRSVIDCWVLWQRWNICQAMTYDTEALYQQVVGNVKNYSHIIYVPPLFEPVEDEFRWIEPDYIKQIDRIIRMSLFELDLWSRTFTISSSDPAARVAPVMDWLRRTQDRSAE